MFKVCGKSMPNGKTCQSPAIRGQSYCFYHRPDGRSDVNRRVMARRAELILDLRGLRNEVNMSLGKVSELSGVPVQTIARIESGALPGLETALAIAKFLETPVEEIWTLVEGNEPSESSENA